MHRLGDFRPLAASAIATICVSFGLAVVLSSVSGVAFGAAPGASHGAARDHRYQTCIAQTQTAPQEAFEAALQWSSDGGGAPALHCQAVALVALKQYGEAATRLQELARRPDSGAAAMRAELLDQAGNAWILADQAQSALAAFDAGLKLAPNSPELLVDRARGRALLRDWQNAASDLSAALSLDPEREEAYVFRASALRQAGHPQRALEDIDTALALNDHDPDALLERGVIQLTLGNKDAARQDWLRTSELAPDSPAGQAARRNLESMDLGSGAGQPPS